MISIRLLDFQMKKSAILAALIISTTAAVLYGLWATRPVAEVYVVRRGTAISAVYGTVKVVASVTMNLRARNSGVIRFSDPVAKNAAVGLEVKQGELLATITNEDLDREITKAEADVKAADERSRVGPLSLSELNTQVAQLSRLEKLAETQNVPASEVDQARNSAQTLRERVQVEQVELDRSASILREQLADLRDRRARGLITSPIDGYLDSINCVNGEFVGEGSIPFVVATKSMYLNGEINEEDVGQIAPKMKAAVRLYSCPDKDLAATVSQILPTANNQRYTVTLTLDEAPPNLMSGMTGEMNIIAGQRENALTVPSSALLGGRVLVVTDNVIKPRDVKVGFRNLERTEVLNGLREGEQVVIADQDLFRPGQRVRAIVRNL
jgi:RND family efflux transporter MFP subunit